MKIKITKWATAGILAGVLLLVSIGFTAFATGSSYQNYKAAILNTVSADSSTTKTEYSIKDNGTEVIKGSMLTQTDKNSRYSHNSFVVDGQTFDMERTQANGTIITHRGDVYTSTILSDTGRSSRGKRNFEANYNRTKLMDMVTDLLMGDVKTQFNGSGDTITLNLSGAQIPELLNVAVSDRIEHGASRNGRWYSDANGNDELCEMFASLSTLQNISIGSISLNATVKDGYIADNNITIIVNGEDITGTAHKVELTMATAVSDIGNTTVSTIDTTGKTVTEVAADNYRSERRNRK